MNDFYLTAGTLPDLIPLLQAELEKESPLKVSVGPPHIGKWSMAKLWRMWMTTTAEFMAGNGVTMPMMISADGEYFGTRKFNEEDAHNLFTHQWLGADDDGKRLSWSKSGRDDMRAADRGERFHALRRHEAWAIDKGIILFKPREGEYHRLEQEENI
jgi:hypothetical protein